MAENDDRNVVGDDRPMRDTSGVGCGDTERKATDKVFS